MFNRSNKDESVTLVCHTDNRTCCKDGGKWYITLLNGETVEIDKIEGNLFVVNRKNGTVNLTFNALNDYFGMFCCQVPNADGIDETTCINSG